MSEVLHQFSLTSVYVEGSDGLIGEDGIDLHFSTTVLLYFRDDAGDAARVRVWTEFSTVGRPCRSDADMLSVRVAHDFLRNGIGRNISLLDDGWTKSDGGPADVGTGIFRFDGAYYRTTPPPVVVAGSDMIRDFRELTAVFWRGDKEFWATASAQMLFPGTSAAVDCIRLMAARCKALLVAAGAIEAEALLGHMTSEPEGGTDVTLF